MSEIIEKIIAEHDIEIYPNIVDNEVHQSLSDCAYEVADTVIKKAGEWLKTNLPPAMVRSDLYMFNGEFIKEFKKAMEKQL